MKKIIFLFATILILITILGASYSNNNQKLPTISAKLITHNANTSINALGWEVQNLSNQKITFVNGNIMNYKIKNIESNKTYLSSELKKNGTVSLKPNETYLTSVSLANIKEKGEYEVTFWAVCDKGSSCKIIKTIRIN